jgi:hypothetical protein
MTPGPLGPVASVNAMDAPAPQRRRASSRDDPQAAGVVPAAHGPRRHFSKPFSL